MPKRTLSLQDFARTHRLPSFNLYPKSIEREDGSIDEKVYSHDGLVECILLDSTVSKIKYSNPHIPPHTLVEVGALVKKDVGEIQILIWEKRRVRLQDLFVVERVSVEDGREVKIRELKISERNLGADLSISPDYPKLHLRQAQLPLQASAALSAAGLSQSVTGVLGLSQALGLTKMSGTTDIPPTTIAPRSHYTFAQHAATPILSYASSASEYGRSIVSSVAESTQGLASSVASIASSIYQYIPTFPSLFSIPGAEAASVKKKPSAAQPKPKVDRKVDEFMITIEQSERSVVKSIEKLSETDAESFLTSVDSKYGLTPLLIAANLGKIKVANAIYSRTRSNPILFKTILTASTQGGITPLNAATIKGDVEFIEKTLSHTEYDPELLEATLTLSGLDPLYIASHDNKVQIMESLLRAIKPYPQLRQKAILYQRKDGQTPLYAASNHGNIDAVKMLFLDTKDDPKLCLGMVSAKAPNGFTSFHTAVNNNELKVVVEMLEAAKDSKELLSPILLIPDERGRIPLYTAANQGNTKITRLILGAAKDDKELLRAMLLHITERNITSLAIAALLGRSGTSKEILLAMSSLDPKDARHILELRAHQQLSVFESLLLLDDIDNAKLALDMFLELPQISSLPYFFYTPQNKLQAFLALNTAKAHGRDISIKPFDQESGFSIDKSEGASPSHDRDLAIMSVKADVSEKTSIILNDIAIDSIVKHGEMKFNDDKRSKAKVDIDKMLKIASTVPGAISASASIRVNSYRFGNSGGEHNINLLIDRNSDGKWQCRIHDSNGHHLAFAPILDAIIDMFSQLGVKASKGTIKEGDVFIPNSSDEHAEGRCDSISRIISAHHASGTLKKLRKECDDIIKSGKDCASVLFQKYIREPMGAILQQRYEAVMDSKSPSTSPTDVTSSRASRQEIGGRDEL